MSDDQIEEGIRQHRDALINYVWEAFKRKLHEKKNYKNFAQYLRTEFGIPETTSYEVATQAKVMFELESVSPGLSTAGGVSKRAAKAIAPHLDKAKERIVSGESVETVIEDYRSRKPVAGEIVEPLPAIEKSDFEWATAVANTIYNIPTVARKASRMLTERPVAEDYQRDIVQAIDNTTKLLGMLKSLVTTGDLDDEFVKLLGE